MNGRTNAKNGAGAIRDGCAVLGVRAQAYSQITATRSDGLTKKQNKGYVDINNSDYWFYYIIIQKFELSNLIWTVTATLGSNIASDTVVIDDSKQFDMVLLYHVPPGYQEVEYIQNTGSAWINFNISPAINFRAVFQACSDVATTDGLGLVYTSGGDVHAWRANIMYKNGKYCIFAAPGESTAIYIPVAMNYGELVDMEYTQSQGSQIFTVNGISVSLSQTGVSARNACSFFRYQGGQTYYGVGKLRHAELYNDGVLVRDMWSCYRISDSVAGMWDKVSETFFTNAGSGTFVLGADV